MILLISILSVTGQTPVPEYIAVSKSGPSVAIPGDLITYTISAGNGSQNSWTGTISDVLPGEFTYSGSTPSANTISGQTLTWNLTIPAGQNRVITVTGFAGKLGSTFNPARNPSTYYMQNSDVTTSLINGMSLSFGTSAPGKILTDSQTTSVKQTCDFSFAGIDGQIKMSTSATFSYLVVVQNLGNVYDRYTLYTDPNNNEFASCTNPDGTASTGNQKLINQILDMNGDPLTVTPWIAPGEPYSFYLKLTTPNGTSARRWNCTDLTLTSALCGKPSTQTFHTATINPINEPILNIYQVDYPDPIACGGTLTYSVFITNLGNKAAYNTIVTNTYDPNVEFISASPAPTSGNNTWNLGQIAISGYAKIDIKVRIKSGVFNEQQILNTVVVNYDNGAQSPTLYTNNTTVATTVNAFPDLLVTKSASPNTLKLGEIITYTLNCSNVGCGIATGVLIEDDYDELHTQIVDAGGGVVSNGKITWNAGNITPQSNVHTITYTLRVTSVDCGSVQIQNNVIASMFEPDKNILNNSAAASVLAVSAPNWTRFPSDVTVDCNHVPVVAEIGATKDVWALDACNRSVSITYSGEVRTNGVCDNKYILTRKWRAVDTDGNFSERSQVITVEDNMSPVITCPSFGGFDTSVDGLGNLTVRLEANTGQNYVVSGTSFNPTATDNCDASPSLTFSLSGSTTGVGSDLNGVTFNKGLTTVTWTAQDKCGNVSRCLYTVIVNADPGITLTKTLLNINGNTATKEFTAVGAVLNYAIVITNSGNVILNNLVVSDPLTTVTGSPVASLAPGATSNLTARYTITQNDLDAGFFRNVAKVTGTTASNQTVEAINSATVLAVQTGRATLNKTSTTSPNNFDQVGDHLTYNLIVSNTGNVTLTNIVITDPSATVSGSPVASLAPGASATITANHTVIQSDLDAGKVVNTASLTGTYTDAAKNPHSVVASSSTSVSAVQTGTVSLNKSSTTIPNSYDNVGDILTYSINVANTGNVTLTNLVVTDPTSTVSGSPIAYLAPSTSVTLSASHTVTQADLNAGQVVNTASVTGTYFDGSNAPHTATASDFVTIPAIQVATVTLDKTSATDPNTIDHPGDIITYNLHITNTGNVTLTNLVVTDPSAIISGSVIASLAPGSSVNLTATHAVTQADLDAGKVDNTASVTGTYHDAGNSALTTTGSDALSFLVTQAASVILDKVSTTNPNNYDQVGDILTYNLVITNTGNVTLTNLAVTDPAAIVSGSPIATLAPGANVTITASHTVTQADLDAEKVDNTASLTATYHDASNSVHTANASDMVTILALQAGGVTLDKISTTNPNTYDQAGDILIYNIVLTNTGNVTLSNLVVTDPTSTVTGSPVATLAPGASVTLTASYTITQADLDAGKVDNSANVSGTYRDAGNNLHTVYGSDNATVTATQSGTVTLDKTSTTNPNNYDQIGDLLTYNLVVTNTGNVTLSNLVVIDPTSVVTGSPIATLAPGTSVTVTASHTVTQADLNAGKVDNNASVSGIYHDSGNNSHTATASDIATIQAVQTGAVTISKISTTNPDNYNQVGNILTYSLVITNTGNVTLSNLTVTDPTATVTGSPIATLVPGASVTLTARHTVTQADLNAGKVDNTASVSGTYRDAANSPHTVTASDLVSIPALQTGSVTLDKISTTNPNNYDQVGDILTYNLVITNTGNVTLTNIVVSDPTSTVTGSPIASLAPGASRTITARHTITQSDLDEGRVENTASLTGTYYDAGNLPHSAVATDNVTILAIQTGVVTLNKVSTTIPNSYDQLGDILTYNIIIANTGNVTLTNLVVTDPSATITGSPIVSLAPGTSRTIIARHTVVQADLDSRQYVNRATVNAVYNDYQNIQHTVTATDSETITAILNPVMTILSTPSQMTYDAVGQSIAYTILVSNPGNVTLTNIHVTDVLTGGDWTIASLPPAGSQTFNTSYVITQADLDAGTVVNVAAASGLDQSGSTVSVSDTKTINASQNIVLMMTKSSNPADYAPVNTNITYTIVLTSGSNVNLLNVQVSDVLPAHSTYVSSGSGGSYNAGNRTVTWNISRINPGESISLQLIVSVDGNTDHMAVLSNTAQATNTQIGTIETNTNEIRALRYPILRLVSVENVSCFGGSNGSAAVEVSGGMPPFVYSWSTTPAQTGPVADNLPAGTYTVKATDAMAFSDELTVTITQPQAALSATAVTQDVICHGESTGAIALQADGGTPPYSFLWSNNATSQILSDLPAGHYSVIISDANGCTRALEEDIQEPEESIKISNIEIIEVTCPDDPFGSIRYDIAGGVSPYTYLWSNNETSMYLENIKGGEYKLTVTDHLGCQLLQNFFVEYKNDNCEIRVPSGLTPNAQFDNKLVIRGLEKYPDNNFKVYNRYGSLIYEAAPYQNDWDGIPNVGHNISEGDGKVPDGTYFYILQLAPGSDPLTGYIYLIKN